MRFAANVGPHVSVLSGGAGSYAHPTQGLLDTLTLTIHPAAAGQGKRLFDGATEPFRLELVDSQVTPVGNAILTYAKKDVRILGRDS